MGTPMGISLKDEGLREEEPFQSNQILMSKPFDSVGNQIPQARVLSALAPPPEGPLD